MMKRKGLLVAMVAAGLLFVVSAGSAKAQVVVGAPIVSYYAPPVVSYYTAPAVSYYSAPVAVSYYTPATTVVAAPAVVPAVSYYPAPAVVYPATVSRGLFGRTTVRTPFYKIRY